MSHFDGQESLPPFPSALHAGADPERRESEAQFRELMGHLQQVFWMKNAEDTAVHYVSPAYETIWGRSRGGLYDGSHTMLDSIHPEDHARMAEVMSRKQETGGYDEEYRIRRPDGSTRWVWARTYPVRDAHGEVQRYAGIAEDVSERKRREQERSRLAALIEHTGDAIVSVTLEGIIVGWNLGAERRYGYQAEEVIGRAISLLIPVDQAAGYQAMLERARRGEPVVDYETVRRCKDGTLVNLCVGISPIERVMEGQVVDLSKASQDIGRVRKLELQLIEAQKMEVIGQLTGGVAHDFNNVLAVILGYGELLQRELGPKHGMNKALAAIQHAAERGAALTRQLLIFSRKETVQFAVLDLNEVLVSLDPMLRQLIDDNIELTITPGPEIQKVKADIGYVGQVAMNLVVNARDAMPGGGKLCVATQDVTLAAADAAAPRGIPPGDYVVLSVSDTGMGMSAAVQSRLFEPFFTTKPKGKGTGLGLATSQTIVRKCGGHIGCSSESGKGTTFKIYFPRISEPCVLTASPFVSAAMPRGTETILVVEDEPELRQLVCRVLRGQGYEVLAAVNGEDGVRTALHNQGPAIRLVISDVIMPQMGGQAMSEWLKTENPELKILFTSGYTDDAIAHHGMMDPDIAFLSKPYSCSTLVRKVRELLDAPLPAAERQECESAAVAVG